MNRAPSIRFDLFLVEHGYQLDIYAGGSGSVSVCRDFGDNLPAPLVATAVMKAIQAALEGIEDADERYLEVCGWTPEALADWRERYDAFMEGDGPDPTPDSDLITVRDDPPWPSF